MNNSKKYLYVLIFIEIQIILGLLIFSYFKLSELDTKIQATNKFMFGIFHDKKMEEIQILDTNDIIIGDSDASVTMMMFTKFDCHVCNDFFITSYNKIKTNYIDKGLVKFVVRHISHKSSKKTWRSYG